MKFNLDIVRKHPAFAMAVNFLTVLILYTAARIFFFLTYKSSFPEVGLSDFLTICKGGLRFDMSALCYLNLLCIILQTLPFKFRFGKGYQRVMKIIFLTVNIIGIVVNVADTIYFQFGGRRTTSTFFSEFAGQSNVLPILLNSFVQDWSVWLFAAISVFAVCFFYYKPVYQEQPRTIFSGKPGFYISGSILFLISVYAGVSFARGGTAIKMHPMRMDTADMYTKQPSQAAIVLNTPFTLITTMHKKDFVNPKFFPDERLDSIFNPIHYPQAEGEFKPYNIVIILMESFSREYVGYYTPKTEEYQGFTPFLDSLITVSYAFDYSFASGIRSVDAMPSVLAGIPRYIEPYTHNSYAVNTIEGLPRMLESKGYRSAFFHGAPNQSLWFNGVTSAAGYDDYYGMTEFADDSQYDGTWAIWDEPFFDFFADKTDLIAKEGKPFLVTVFSASSHQPYKVPQKYEGKFKKGVIEEMQAVAYADYSLKKYFERVKNSPWYKNTIFVFTADHTGPFAHDEYKNECGRFLIPIFFYAPGGQLPVKMVKDRLMQQIDVAPSLLSLLNYDKPFFSFGKNIFSADTTHFVNFVFNDNNGTSQYYLDSLMIQYNHNKLSGVYKFKEDLQLRNNLIDSQSNYPQIPFMETQIKAIIQQYIVRMKANKLTYQNSIK